MILLVPNHCAALSFDPAVCEGIQLFRFAAANIKRTTAFLASVMLAVAAKAILDEIDCEAVKVTGIGAFCC
jgi:ribosome biogenesis protein Tsr3